MFRDRGIEIKTPEQIEQMRRAGLVVGETLELLRGAVARRGHHRPSSTRSPRSTSGRRRDPVVHGLPRRSRRSICASVNDEVVHGIPGDRVLPRAT